jgi:hypothetical protein
MKKTFELIVIIVSLIGFCRCGDDDITSTEPIEPEGTGIICKFLKNDKIIYVRIYIQQIEVDINDKWTKVTVKYQYPFIPK